MNSTRRAAAAFLAAACLTPGAAAAEPPPTAPIAPIAPAVHSAPDLPRCPARPGDLVFLPCGERIAFQPAPGRAIEPYAGVAPPSDGPLLDLLAGDRALRSAGGLLEAELRMVTGTEAAPMLVGSRPYRVASFEGQNRVGGIAAAYNGIFPGPSLVLQPGDRLRLRISDARIPDAVLQASPLHFDPTVPVPQASNIHTHGLLVGPTGEGDNVYRAFLPGNRYLTEVRLGADHPEGLNWYHPHMHGSTAPQVFGGMAGLIQVGGPVAPAHRPLVAGLTSRQLVFSGLALARSPRDPDLFLLGPVANATAPVLSDPNPAAAAGGPRTAPDYRPSHLVNGQLNPVIAMRPGETQLWTASNVNVSAAYSLALLRLRADGTVDPATPLFRTVQLGQDGNARYRPVAGHLIRHRDPMADFHLTPGERLAWTVTAPMAPGTYHLVNIVDRAYARQVPDLPAMLTFQPPTAFVPSLILATVEVAGPPDRRPPPHFPDTAPPDFVAAPSVLTRRIAFDFDEQYLRGRVNFGTFPATPAIQSFAGDVETWEIATHSQVAHPIHIHQGDFIVEEIAYYEDQALTRLRRDLPQNPVAYPFRRLMDTLSLPGRSRVRIRMRASAFTGKFVMHCHMLLHEDSGMMASVAVAPPREQELIAIAGGSGPAAAGPPRIRVLRAADGAEVARLRPEAWPEIGSGNEAGQNEAGQKKAGDAPDGGTVAVGHPLPGGIAHLALAPRRGRPVVRLLSPHRPADAVLELRPFGGAGDGASVALGDIDGDAVDEILVGSGRGTAPSVAIYKLAPDDGGEEGGEDGSRARFRLWLEVPVLDDSHAGSGVRVAAADIDGDNWDDLIVANGPGSRNRIAVLSGHLLAEAAGANRALVEASGDTGFGRELRLSTCAGSAREAVIADLVDPLPGSEGLNIAAGLLGAGFATYPPVAVPGNNPAVPLPYRAQIAVTRAAARTDPEVAILDFVGSGGHDPALPAGDPAVALRPIALFTPFPGERAAAGGLSLATGLTVAIDPNTPVTGLVSALHPERLALSHFAIGGGIRTMPWAAGAP